MTINTDTKKTAINTDSRKGKFICHTIHIQIKFFKILEHNKIQIINIQYGFNSQMNLTLINFLSSLSTAEVNQIMS